jgi:hypothetical protein
MIVAFTLLSSDYVLVAFILLSSDYVLEQMKARKCFKPIMLFLICQRGDTFYFGSFSMGPQVT